MSTQGPKVETDPKKIGKLEGYIDAATKEFEQSLKIFNRMKSSGNKVMMGKTSERCESFLKAILDYSMNGLPKEYIGAYPQWIKENEQTFMNLFDRAPISSRAEQEISTMLSKALGKKVATPERKGPTFEQRRPDPAPQRAEASRAEPTLEPLHERQQYAARAVKEELQELFATYSKPAVSKHTKLFGKIKDKKKIKAFQDAWRDLQDTYQTIQKATGIIDHEKMVLFWVALDEAQEANKENPYCENFKFLQGEIAEIYLVQKGHPITTEESLRNAGMYSAMKDQIWGKNPFLEDLKPYKVSENPMDDYMEVDLTDQWRKRLDDIKSQPTAKAGKGHKT